MSEYLSKKAVLEWFGLMHLEYSHNAAVSEFIESGIEIFESGAFDVPDMEHINAYWAREGLIKRQQEEIQRLRAALEWIVECSTDYQSINKARNALHFIKGGEKDD